MDSPVSAFYFPMLAMFLWTFGVMLRNVQVRVHSVLQGRLTNAYFELFQGAEPSEAVIKTGNHLRNLFEFPVLFYAALLTAALLQKTATFLVVLAWIYVGLRVGHSLVHLSFNKVPVRFLFYILSNIVLLAIWLSIGFVA